MSTTDVRSLKTSIFASSNKIKKSKIIKFFGVDVEVRQSSLRDIINRSSIGNGTTEDTTDNMPIIIHILMNNTFVPGTDIPVFDEADIEQLESMPYGSDFNDIVEAYNTMSGISVEKAIKNSAETTSV